MIDRQRHRHRKAEVAGLGSLMEKLQYPGGTVCLLYTIEQGGRFFFFFFLQGSRVYGMC